MPEEFDSSLEALDWRYSAAIVGLWRFLEYSQLPFNRQEILSGKELDCLRYNKADITEDRYLKFAEHFYGEEFPHKKAEKMLQEEVFSEEDIKEINAQLTFNVVLKKFFSKNKFDGQNREQIEEILAENRNEIVRETFRNKTSMYRNYCNTNLLFSDAQEVCRLNGYYVDWAKKGKSASYRMDTSLFLGNDISEFDFIPFAFTEYMDGFFINYNSSLHDLINANQRLRHALLRVKKNAEEEGKRFSMKQVLFEELVTASDFLNYDVELIEKEREKDFFTTIYLRKKSIAIFKRLNSLKSRSVFNYSYKVTDNYYIYMLEEVMEAITNLTTLDKVIEVLLKAQEQEKGSNYSGLLRNLIFVNEMIYQNYGGDEMKRKDIEECAQAIANKLDENKLAAYRTKLTSALVFKDYSRVCEILLQLSNFSNVSVQCLMDVFENCEENKNKVYLFIASLRKQGNADKNEGGAEQ